MLWINLKLRVFHRWLGVLLFPWVLAYGLTGLYMNHGKAFLSVFPQDQIDGMIVEDRPGAFPDAASVVAWAKTTAHADVMRSIKEASYHNHAAWIVTLDDRSELIAFKNSSQYVHKTRYERSLYASDQSIIDSHTYWPRILRELHERGMVSSPFGTFFADLFSIALILFAVSGILAFLLPKLARLRMFRRTRDLTTANF